MSKENENIKLVPELRFAEFVNDQGWKKTTLGHVAEFVDSLHETPKEYIDVGYPMVRVADVNDEGLDLKGCLRVSKDVFEHFTKRYKPQNGDLIFSRVGSCGDTVLIDFDEQVCMGQNTVLLKAKENNLFLFFYLKSSLIKDQVKRNVVGSSYKTLSLKNAKNFVVFLPMAKEQQKIAATLTSLDDLIAAENEKLDALQDHKKGLLQQLFPEKGEKVPKLRFGEFSEEWEEKKLGSIAENLSNKRIPITSSKREKGNIPYYGATGIIDYVKDFIFEEDLLLISEDGANLMDRNYPIAFSISGKTWVNNHAHVLKFENRFTEALVKRFINSRNIEDYLTGQAQPKLNRKNLDSFPIPLPKDPKEEREIASCFISLDELITSQSDKIESIKEHKKGLMQQMFPNLNAKRS